MAGLTPLPLPPVPVLTAFPEINVRTYVHGSAGPGIWFASLDIPRLIGVPFPRVAFGQPYAWARARISRRGAEVRWWSRRRLPGPRGATMRLGLAVDGARHLDDLDRWLVNRWGVYSIIAGRLCWTPVAHTPWPLRDATVTVLQDDLGAAAGWPLGTVERLHHADLVQNVRIGLPRPVQRSCRPT
jgi:uncharacterized protein YqjF (DUF2071 family)